MSIQQFEPQNYLSDVCNVLSISGLELVTPRLRTISGTILNCFYALGGIYLGLIAMWFLSYKVLLLITYVPSFIVLSYIYLLPQSISHYFNSSCIFERIILFFVEFPKGVVRKLRHTKTSFEKFCILMVTNSSNQTSPPKA